VIGLGRGLDLPITAEGERDDEAALLGKRNKTAGRRQATGRMMPAHQGIEAGDFSVSTTAWRI